MEIDVRHIAKLSKLEIPNDKLEAFTKELTALVGMVENLPELTSADALLDVEDTMPLRADETRPSYPREAILQNAPKQANGCFVVPKTVD